MNPRLCPKDCPEVPQEPSDATLIMIVDPESERRRRLVANLDRSRVIDAISLHEAYSLAEETRPSLVALSERAAQEPGLEMFLQLAALVGASCVVFGNRPPSDLPSQVQWVPYSLGDDPRKILESKPYRVRTTAAPAPQMRKPEIIVIGASTGGIAAIETVLASFTAECPPTLIVQHIRPGFVDSMVERLERGSAPRVVKATHGALLTRGTVFVAADDKSHLTLTGRQQPRCAIVPAPDCVIHRPSVDALFHSAADYGPRVCAAILTGMGADGAAGLAAIRAAGGTTIAQDKKSSTVYGMPRVAAEMGAAMAILPLDRIGAALLSGLESSVEGKVQ